MDYEQKYKEALEKLRYKITDDSNKIDYKAIVTSEELESIFPELKESEDEKIRKEIIAYLKDRDFDIEESWIAWLEKQGKRKPNWSEEDEERLQDVIYWFEIFCDKNKTKPEMKESLDWLKSLKDRVQPQPKQEWNVQDEAFLGDAIYAAKETYSENCGQEELIEWLKSFKPHNWKPTEEQMEALSIAVHDAHGNTYYKNLFSLYNDLKKL